MSILTSRSAKVRRPGGSLGEGSAGRTPVCKLYCTPRHSAQCARGTRQSMVMSLAGEQRAEDEARRCSKAMGGCVPGRAGSGGPANVREPSAKLVCSYKTLSRSHTKRNTPASHLPVFASDQPTLSRCSTAGTSHPTTLPITCLCLVASRLAVGLAHRADPSAPVHSFPDHAFRTPA
ncbi:hypothetical protein OH76DRAFT_44692 [Lentinus brumalis]|uniref:Uncharacterized protein n=1 Tax=Lentinus brumalis TaxID=2498619 RepID=A0A371DY40_9APHY|nr:hypothetical protein OH76DRAFT_44692 [Polyporus brumalis]